MSASTCIYMYCNIEMNIMRKQYVSPNFGIHGKISMYWSFVSRDCIFYVFKNLFASNFCTGLKPIVNYIISFMLF